MKISNKMLRQIIKEEIRDYYRNLDLSVTDNQKVIKKSYRKMAMKTHPDRGGNKEDFQDVQQSYEVLSDPEKKSELDKGLLDSARRQKKENPGAKFDGTTGLRLSDENIATLEKLVGTGQDSQQRGGSSNRDDFDRMKQEMEQQMKFMKTKQKIINALSAKINEKIKQQKFDHADNFLKIMEKLNSTTKMEDLKDYMGFAK